MGAQQSTARQPPSSRPKQQLQPFPTYVPCPAVVQLNDRALTAPTLDESIALFREALRECLAAHNDAHPTLQHNLACKLYERYGPAAEVEAKALWVAAGKRSHPFALMNLGRLLEQKGSVLALAFYQHSAALGFQPAVDYVREAGLSLVSGDLGTLWWDG